jgi:hypothetical protein
LKASDETRALETEAAASAATVSPPRNLFRPQTFKALHYRNFALLWVACSYRTPGRGCRLSHSHSLSCSLRKTRALLLGVISFVQASPFLIFSLVGGGVADRVDKRRLLLVTQNLQNWLRVYLGDPDCNGSRTVLVYRCIVGARRNHA